MVNIFTIILIIILLLPIFPSSFSLHSPFSLSSYPSSTFYDPPFLLLLTILPFLNAFIFTMLTIFAPLSTTVSTIIIYTKTLYRNPVSISLTLGPNAPQLPERTDWRPNMHVSRVTVSTYEEDRVTTITSELPYIEMYWILQSKIIGKYFMKDYILCAFYLHIRRFLMTLSKTQTRQRRMHHLLEGLGKSTKPSGRTLHVPAEIRTGSLPNRSQKACMQHWLCGEGFRNMT